MAKEVKFGRYFLWLLLIDIIFTLGDWIVHYSVESLEVYAYPIPDAFLFISTSPLFWYAVGKFVATLIMGAVLFFFVRKGKKDWSRALILAIPVIILMEVRYIISGSYTNEWHVYNTINHFVILYAASWIVFHFSKLYSSKR